MSQDEAIQLPANRTENPIRRASNTTPERGDSCSYDYEEVGDSGGKRARRAAVSWSPPAAAAVVSLEQLQVMMDFLERNRDMALGRFGRTMDGRAIAKRGWEAFAARMNGVENGAYKTASQWRQFYSEYKSRTLSKVRAYKASLAANGGDEHRAIALSSIQQRLCTILGLHGRRNPLETNATDDGDQQETTRSQPSSSLRAFAWSVDEPADDLDERKPIRRYSSDNEEPKPRPRYSNDNEESKGRRYSCDNEFDAVGINCFGDQNGFGSALSQLNGLEQSRTRAMEVQSAATERNTRAVEALTTSILALADAVTSLVEETARKRRREE